MRKFGDSDKKKHCADIFGHASNGRSGFKDSYPGNSVLSSQTRLVLVMKCTKLNYCKGEGCFLAVLFHLSVFSHNKEPNYLHHFSRDVPKGLQKERVESYRKNKVMQKQHDRIMQKNEK